MVTNDEVSKKAFINFAGTAARSIAMRNANMSSEIRAEIVEL
jgi:ATP-binding protein involved in chromosome partitioning